MTHQDLPGYDAWKLASPPEHECADPECEDPDCEGLTPPEEDPDLAYDLAREDAYERSVDL